MLSMKRVVLRQCNEYSNCADVLKSCMKDMGGLAKFVKKGDKVLLKLNLLGTKSVEACVSPHPDLVEALILLLKKRGCSVSVGDSPGGKVSSLAVLKANGIYPVVEKHGVSVVDLKTSKMVKIKDGEMIKSIELAKELDDFDKVINVAKLKTHMLCTMTLCAKNLYGCVPGLIKAKKHVTFQDPVSFSKLILDLNKIVVPTLNVLDGVWGMEGQGPYAGEPRHFGIIGVSDSALAIDYEVCKILGVVKKTPLAYLCDLPEYELIGDDIAKIRNLKMPRISVNGLVPKFVTKSLRFVFTPKPHYDWSKCINCNKCVDICGSHALTKSKPHPNFDRRKCVSCYCCHEMCPKHVISVKQWLFGRLKD